MRARDASAAAGPERIRTFVAVRLTEDVRARLDEAVGRLRGQAPRLAWTREENLHVTIRFLGEVEPPLLDIARQAVRAAARRVAPFELTLLGLGAFPGPRAPRVVWAGVAAGTSGLVALEAAVSAELETRGVPREARPFHAHVTLARCRDPRDARGLATVLGGGPGLPLGTQWVERVSLMRSDLLPGGARHGVLAEVGLGDAPGPEGPVGSSDVDFTVPDP